ncbi:CU044_5270 family protein [Streptosporangium sp. NPDC002524]|uniref:CU044_5270 family protein n=1 Tax=Streptosporangium sp. NPDC002524 TaxID=3154537 RepID=UPI00332FFE2B
MNPVDQLRAARPEHLGDTPVDPRTRAAELSRAMAWPRRAPARRGAVRPGWGLGLGLGVGLGLAGAAAAVTAVAVTVSATDGTVPDAPPAQADPARTVFAPSTSGPSTSGPSASGPSASNPSASGPSASSSSVPAPQTEVSSRSVLLAAAHGAARQPDTTGAYWHTASVTRNLLEAADGDYTLVERTRNEAWTPLATGADRWDRTWSLGARPASAEDEAAWKRAGSPARIEVEFPGKRGSRLGGYVLSTEPGEAKDSHAPLVDGDKVFWLGRNVTMRDLRGLPADPDALKAWLLRSYRGMSTEADIPMASDAWLFSVAVGLVTDMPITPKVRGAAFRMLADLKTIKVARGVTDAEGRTGSAVSIEERARAKVTDKSADDGALRNRLIFDEATGRALATESVVVRPGGLQAGFEPGTVWHSETVLETGWTDERPAS